ncbi:MAG: DEAD/DEAH box helicase [Bradymonadaceae bacterium]
MPGELMDIAGAYLSQILGKIWLLIAALLDLARNLSGGATAIMAVGYLGLLVGAAWLMQRRLNGKLEAEPADDVSILWQECVFSLPGLFCFLIELPFLIVYWFAKWVFSLLVGLLGGSTDDGSEKAEEPLATATLGPSFFLAGFVTFGIYLISLAAEPLLRAQFDLSAGYPAWQYLLLGHQPYLAWYLPLSRFPPLWSLASVVVWGTIWWWVGRAIRLYYADSLGRNLIDDRGEPGVLDAWREWFAATDLLEPDESYMRWAVWAPVGASPFLLWTWWTTGERPYRMDASLAAVTLMLWLGWSLHLLLSGVERPPEPEEEEEDEEVDPDRLGWPDVLDELEASRQLDRPEPVRPPRAVPTLPLRSLEGRSREVLSPLVTELVPGDERLTRMQRDVLATLSLQGFVHTEPPVDPREMSMSDTTSGRLQSEEEMRHRNQVVLAPEGSGKSTLALIAAANEKLVHTRSTLIVARDAERADELYESFRRAVETSTLRWNVRGRRVGDDMVDDLSRGILPDIAFVSLEELVLDLLDSPSAYRSFLENLGLVVVDDVESFCGAIELHAQLGFRRLSQRVRAFAGVRQLGEESAPRMLVLGSDTMQNTAMWARSLCGIDAVTRVFGRPESRSTGDGQPVRQQSVYRGRDFRNASGEPLEAVRIAEACERLGLPWHYRPAGDGRRERGRGALNLREEPEHHVEDPADACAVLVEGHVSQVHRELDRLARAGSRFNPFAAAGHDDVDATPEGTEIGVVTVIDRDEATAFTELDRNAPLADAIDSLPRPIVRPPVGELTESHLAAELTDHWLETEDILDVFGNETVRTLDRLARADLLMTEERTDVRENRAEYETQLYVRVPATAVGGGRELSDREETVALPSPVSQVELPGVESVAIRDRTNLTQISRTAAGSAPYVYYAGRIFESPQGRYVVVGTVEENRDELEETGPVSDRDILVEPYLDEEISSPRRRTRIAPAGGGEDGFATNPVFVGDAPVGVGLETVSVEYRHLATYRLGPEGGEVRQRIVQSGGADPRELETEALAVVPNPAALDRDEAPALTLRGARVVAAAMRAVLPVVYRGSDTHTEVMLHVEGDDPPMERELSTEEGLFLCDPHAGGRGSARAIHRDGVELVLRFCRLYLERVLDYDRLLARFDHWATEASARESGSDLDDVPDDELRREVLEWLDSRLRPEGGPIEPAAGEAVESSGREPGEGDVIDIGRAWYSPAERPEDLIWTKHRWQLADSTAGATGEAMAVECDLTDREDVYPTIEEVEAGRIVTVQFGGDAMADIGLDRHVFADLTDSDSEVYTRWSERVAGWRRGDDDGVVAFHVGAVRSFDLAASQPEPEESEAELVKSPPPRVRERVDGAAARIGAHLEPLEPLTSLLGGEILESGRVGSTSSVDTRRRDRDVAGCGRDPGRGADAPTGRWQCQTATGRDTTGALRIRDRTFRAAGRRPHRARCGSAAGVADSRLGGRRRGRDAGIRVGRRPDRGLARDGGRGAVRRRRKVGVRAVESGVGVAVMALAT